VRTADHGAAALDCLQRENFDAVLIDCQLPSHEGASLCCQIHALPGCASLPVFMLAQGTDREHCAPGTRIDYLNKPVKFEDLQTALERRVLSA
jgi:response regulator RpfG family c-di-GMP phosphodiesterase